MKQVRIAELKDHLSEHLRGVELEVTDRRRPIVRLVPIRTSASAVMIPAQRPFSQIRRKRFRPARWAMRSLDLLLEERGRPTLSITWVLRRPPPDSSAARLSPPLESSHPIISRW
jgi:antitoxin (DNA-binding transcriptional repressor) of toxin-antitoxin stability system